MLRPITIDGFTFYVRPSLEYVAREDTTGLEKTTRIAPGMGGYYEIASEGVGSGLGVPGLGVGRQQLAIWLKVEFDTKGCRTAGVFSQDHRLVLLVKIFPLENFINLMQCVSHK